MILTNTYTDMETMLNLIHKFLQDNLNADSAIPLTIRSVTCLPRELTDDYGNEYCFLAKCEPTDSDTYYSEHEPVINIRKLNNALQQEDFANGDHAITIESYIGLNTSILIPITCLK